MPTAKKFPPQSSAMLAHLDSTYGAAYIGTIASTVLYGVSCVQAFYYYTNQNDPWYIKHVVTSVMICDTVHQAFIAQILYTYTITDWGDPARLGIIIWSVVGEVIFTGITGFIVQSFFTMRIWRVSHRNIYLTGISAILATGAFLTLLVYVAKSFQFKSVPELVKLNRLIISVTLLNALADVLIAATLCTLLNISRTGLHETEIIINRLIVFTVNTGLITSLCALGSLISLLVARSTFIYIAFLLCLGRLYTITFLATLNYRKIIRNVNEERTISFALRDFHTNGSNQAPRLSIHIDTTAETYHPGNDQTFEAKPGIFKPHVIC